MYTIIPTKLAGMLKRASQISAIHAQLPSLQGVPEMNSDSVDPMSATMMGDNPIRMMIRIPKGSL